MLCLKIVEFSIIDINLIFLDYPKKKKKSEYWLFEVMEIAMNSRYIDLLRFVQMGL